VYGYYPNASKTWLIVKSEFLAMANKVFKGTGVNLTTDGRRHLGAALGCCSFTEQYMKEKVDCWLRSIHRLSEIVKIHPHSAYCAFVHGMCSKWTYFIHTIPEASSFFAPLEEGWSRAFIPALSNNSINGQERALFALPVRLGGLGIRKFLECSDDEFAASLKVILHLVEAILCQQLAFDLSICDVQHHNKLEILTIKHKKQSELAAELHFHLLANLQCTLSLASEKGVSSWLSTLPVEEHGSALHKVAFRDALCLHYGWLPSSLSTNCFCDQGFSVDDTMNCLGMSLVCFFSHLFSFPQFFFSYPFCSIFCSKDPNLALISPSSQRFMTALLEYFVNGVGSIGVLVTGDCSIMSLVIVLLQYLELYSDNKLL